MKLAKYRQTQSQARRLIAFEVRIVATQELLQDRVILFFLLA